ncbi:MAG: Trm112 family protein [Candidatus Omnitrophica bacterium]|nr:Trm112 family protein [Candidatus Omnitrophota bacterium]
MDKELLNILCCPTTKVPVKPISEDQVQKLNEIISRHALQYVDGRPVEGTVQEGLITEDGRTIYLISDGIPVMLPELGIAADQLQD